MRQEQTEQDQRAAADHIYYVFLHRPFIVQVAEEKSRG